LAPSAAGRSRWSRAIRADGSARRWRPTARMRSSAWTPSA
jgi:hypothetical protein